MRRAILCLIPVWSLPGCAADDQRGAGVERTDSAGVAIVRYARSDHALSWGAVPRFALGGADTGAEAFFRIGPGAIQVDHEANMYILDRGNHRVVAFDAEGEHVGTFGRRGSGPGELERPIGLFIGPNGEIAVLDQAKQAAVRWTVSGELLSPASVSIPPITGRLVETAYGWVHHEIRMRLNEPTLERLVLANGDGRELARLEAAGARMIAFESCGITIPADPIFAPSLAWAARGDRIAVAEQPGYTVDLFLGARRVLSVRRQLEPPAASRALALEEVGDGPTIRLGGEPCTIDPEEAIQKRGYTEAVPLIEAVELAPDGTVWVERFTVGDESGPIDLFGPDGEYRGTLPAAFPRPATFLPDGDVVAVEVDDLGVEHVVVYDIENRQR